MRAERGVRSSAGCTVAWEEHRNGGQTGCSETQRASCVPKTSRIAQNLNMAIETADGRGARGHVSSDNVNARGHTSLDLLMETSVMERQLLASAGSQRLLHLVL